MSEIINPFGWTQFSPPGPTPPTDQLAVEILSHSPRHYWRMGTEDTGSTVTDYGSANTQGTWNGAPTKGEPPLSGILYGGSTTFADNDYVGIPDTVVPLTRDSAWSVVVFVKGNDWSGKKSIFEFNTDDGKTFILVGRDAIADRWSIGGNLAAGWSRTKYSPNPSTNTTMITVVFDGADYTADSSFKLYQNTSQSSQSAGSNGGGSIPIENRIGENIASGHEFTGGLQDLAVFPHALSPSDIADIYTAATT